MNSPEETPRASLESWELSLLLVAVSLPLGRILLPFFGTILWGAVIALLFAPLYRWLLSRLGGRRSTAAILTVLAVLLIVILPLVGNAASLAR